MKSEKGFTIFEVTFLGAFLVLIVWFLITLIQVKPAEELTSDTFESASENEEISNNIGGTTQNYDLEIVELENSKLQITDSLNKIQFEIPDKYVITGDTRNYAIGIKGIKAVDGPDLQDFAQLQVRREELEVDLAMLVEEEYLKTTKNTQTEPNLAEIKEIKAGQLNGYSYSCPFLVEQTCMYFALEDTTEYYLFVRKSLSDDFYRGYEREITNILSSIKVVSYLE